MSKKPVDNMTFSPSQITRQVEALLTSQLSVFLWGPPGIAKSALMKFLAKKHGYHFIDVRLSQMEPTDLRGIPYPLEEHGQTTVKWSSPACLPRNLDLDVAEVIKNGFQTIRFPNPHSIKPIIEAKTLEDGYNVEIVSQTDHSFTIKTTNTEGEIVPALVQWTVQGKVKAILALEELNSAPQSVQAAAYQLLLDRKLGDEYIVPEDVFIICMGNRDQDRGVTFKMPTPIMNRLIHLEMRPDLVDWKEWAVSEEAAIDHTVVGFLSVFQEQLFNFDAKSADRGFPTPRTWEFASRISRTRNSLSEGEYLGLLAGAVGQSSALQFLEYQKLTSQLPSPNDILDGKVTQANLKDGESNQLQYALVYSLVYALRERVNSIQNITSDKAAQAEAIRLIDLAMNFASKNVKRELAVVAFHTAITMSIPHVSRSKSFEVFAEDMTSIVNASRG